MRILLEVYHRDQIGGKVPSPQVSERHHYFDEYMAKHSSLMGQPPYMPRHISINTLAQMVPPSHIAYEAVLAVNDQQRYERF